MLNSMMHLRSDTSVYTKIQEMHVIYRVFSSQLKIPLLIDVFPFWYSPELFLKCFSNCRPAPSHLPYHGIGLVKYRDLYIRIGALLSGPAWIVEQSEVNPRQAAWHRRRAGNAAQCRERP